MSCIYKSLGISLVPVLFGIVFLGASPAAALEPAKGEIVLTVVGEISFTNSRDAAEFDIEMLESIGLVTFDTSTIWNEGVQTFTGVQLVDLLFPRRCL